MKNLFLLLFSLILSLSAFSQKSTGDDLALAEELQVYIPNAFTPNFDSYNDVFGPVFNGPEIVAYEFTILDRSGKQVFYSTDPTEVWNGSSNGGDYLTSTGVFVYFLKVKAAGNIDTKTFKGHVVLVR